MPTIFTAQQAAQVFDPLASTYNKSSSYHRSDVGFLVHKAAIQGSESVLDLGTGTGWVATEARRLTTGRIVGVDISPKMVAEARRHAKDDTLQIAYLVGDMITLHGLDAIKPPGGFDVITCLWAFSNVAAGQRLAMLNRWKDFLAPGGRIVLELQHPNNDLASFDVENESGKSVFRWKMSNQQSLVECVAAWQALGDAAGLRLIGELESIGVEGYEDQEPNLKAVLAGQQNPSHAQIEGGKQTLLQRLVNYYWPKSGESGRPVVLPKTVSVMGVWQKC